MTPDTIPTAVGLPLAAALWALVALPYLASKMRARRADRKAIR